HEIIDPATGDVVGSSSQTLYGTRTWHGEQSSPLLFAGQYYDDESGWAYNRFRYYHPDAGVYNTQDPLGAAPRIASAQRYVDHPAYWVDVFGLHAHTLADNVAKGANAEKAAEDLIKSKLGDEGWAKQVTTRADVPNSTTGKDWTNSRTDFLVKGNDGSYHFIEIKSGDAQLTANQQTISQQLGAGNTVEMRSGASKKIDPLGVAKEAELSGTFHTFNMDQANDVENLSRLLDRLA
ncbi:RHS repeat-associated core domain-containing protein, partial [Corynebacterium cystitidis]|uniref:RHS repeat-associated core domain-containing protein n=1 Tax=Corynebacterium cystitidis TaxID=35757 RepID=UPI0027B90256